jgi:hypothetical protein
MDVSANSSSRRPVRLAAAVAVLAGLICAVFLAPPAMAEFGLDDFNVIYADRDATPGDPFDDPPALQAGSHPYALTTFADVKTFERDGKFFPAEELSELLVDQVPGLAGAVNAVPPCSTKDFLAVRPETAIPQCSDDSAIGVVSINLVKPDWWFNAAVYSIEPPPGVPFAVGFNVLGVRTILHLGVKDAPPYNIVAKLHKAPQALLILGSVFQLWGVPSDPGHDSIRGKCAGNGLLAWSRAGIDLDIGSTGSCPSTGSKPLITLPRSCDGPQATRYEAASWLHPDRWVSGSVLTHDNANPPNPQGFTGCDKLGFSPSVLAQTTADSAETGTGLDFTVEFNDEGLPNPVGLAESDIEKTEVTLPEGITVNPSAAEGLGVCTPTDFDRETLASAPGEGCPNASKVGTLHLETPIVDESIDGSVYLAEQDDPRTSEPGAENPFDSLIALYMVLKNTNLGVNVKLPLKVEPDPRTGQLVTTLEDVPQIPFSHFTFHFREGVRATLVTPARCGTYTTEAKLWPRSNPDNPKTLISNFEITQGKGGGPCPAGGVPPFKPNLDAGTINNAAGSYSPFNVRLTRNDGEQEFTNFSIKLPPGIVGKLAGIPFCPDAAIEAAKSRTGIAELASPSCPKASEVGHTLVGAGVGSALTYAPGKVYLAGPYHGSSLSIAAITAGVVGPFDVGTVVVREALKINPETAEVFIDPVGSDPIPHIIKGIVVHARDIRVYVDRPEFVLNPTNCKRTSTASTVLGSGLDFASSADDEPITVTSPFQAASCASLGFKPKLALSLKGGTKRGENPAFKAVLTARKGDANIGEAQVTLPHSEFLDQSHIKTVCTRVQFKEGSFPGEKCPAASVYGYATAITPLLDEPIQGPVFLRSSSHNLPDLVAALHSGKIDVNLVGRIDSVKGGRIRNTFEKVPDAPVTKFTLTMQGGKKGLLVNSTNLCKSTNRAISHFVGQNGKVDDTNPILKPQCKKAKGKQKRAAKRSAR